MSVLVKFSIKADFTGSKFWGNALQNCDIHYQHLECILKTVKIGFSKPPKNVFFLFSTPKERLRGMRQHQFDVYSATSSDIKPQPSVALSLHKQRSRINSANINLIFQFIRSECNSDGFHLKLSLAMISINRINIRSGVLVADPFERKIIKWVAFRFKTKQSYYLEKTNN